MRKKKRKNKRLKSTQKEKGEKRNFWVPILPSEKGDKKSWTKTVACKAHIYIHTSTVYLHTIFYKGVTRELQGRENLTIFTYRLHSVLHIPYIVHSPHSTYPKSHVCPVFFYDP